VDHICHLVDCHLQAGADLAAVEREIIDAAPWLDPERRAAAWLYAWLQTTRRDENRRRALSTAVT
jgi:hypothetical protein